MLMQSFVQSPNENRAKIELSVEWVSAMQRTRVRMVYTGAWAQPKHGAEVDDWGCAMAWMPVLMIDNSQQQRSTGAAVESFRNEMVKANAMSP
jgi:hypothetical protein